MRDKVLLLVVILGVLGTSFAGPRKINGPVPDDVQQELDDLDIVQTKDDDLDQTEEVSTITSVLVNDTNDYYYDDNLDGESDDGSLSKNVVTLPSTNGPESKVLPKGKKRRKLTKSANKSKKMWQQLIPLLLIPLMIQAQIIPMMLFKLKLMAVKALMIGKAALLIIVFNVVKNYMLGADTMESQYEHETLASNHYGYTGSPEYGAWINKRWDSPQTGSNTPYRGHVAGESITKANGIHATTDSEENA